MCAFHLLPLLGKKGESKTYSDSGIFVVWISIYRRRLCFVPFFFPLSVNVTWVILQCVAWGSSAWLVGVFLFPLSVTVTWVFLQCVAWASSALLGCLVYQVKSFAFSKPKGEIVVSWSLAFRSGKSHVPHVDSPFIGNISHPWMSRCDVISLTPFLLVALDVRQLSLFRIRGHSLFLSLI